MKDNNFLLNDVAIIILNYNSLEDTMRCVNALLSFHDIAPHIVVVDNCSSDNSYDVLEENLSSKGIDVIKSDGNKGYSAGNNFGIKFAKKKYNINTIGIMNPDIVIPKSDVLINLYKNLWNYEDACIVGGVIKNSSNIIDSAWDIPSTKNLLLYHSIIPFVRKNKKNLSSQQIDDNTFIVECIVGCFFLAKLELFERIGMFDENVFLYNEENILGLKCKNNGFIELLVNNQYYFHNHKDSKRNHSFKSKINVTRNSYLSRCYLCGNFYSKVFLPLLWLVELLNKVYLGLIYIVSHH